MGTVLILDATHVDGMRGWLGAIRRAPAPIATVVLDDVGGGAGPSTLVDVLEMARAVVRTVQERRASVIVGCRSRIVDAVVAASATLLEYPHVGTCTGLVDLGHATTQLIGRTVDERANRVVEGPFTCVLSGPARRSVADVDDVMAAVVRAGRSDRSGAVRGMDSAMSGAGIVVCVGGGVVPSMVPPLLRWAHPRGVQIVGTKPAVATGAVDTLVGWSGVRLEGATVVTLGVRGAPHALWALDDCDWLVAVDVDERAPIFRYADEGYRADANDVIRALTSDARHAIGDAP